MPRGCPTTGGCYTFGRVLGSSLPGTRTGRIDRGRAARAATATERGTDRSHQPGGAEQTKRCRHASEPVGREDSVGMDREDLWDSTEGAPMPTFVSPVGVSSPQAATGAGQS